jgi:hypothetical protein
VRLGSDAQQHVVMGDNVVETDLGARGQSGGLSIFVTWLQSSSAMTSISCCPKEMTTPFSMIKDYVQHVEMLCSCVVEHSYSMEKVSA